MSVVTNLVLVYNIVDRMVVSGLLLDEDTEEQRFVDVTESVNKEACGPRRKMMTLRLSATAVNYFSVEQLAERIERLLWEAPESVLLLVQGENDVRPAVWGFDGAHHFRCVDKPLKFVCLLEAVPS